MTGTLRSGRFMAVPNLSGEALLMIVDYVWWMDHERDILNWMVDNLPRGIEHQQGMSITFDTEQDRLMFLLRWG